MHFHLSSLQGPENKTNVIDEHVEKSQQSKTEEYNQLKTYRPGWLICVPELGVDNNLVRLNHEST